MEMKVFDMMPDNIYKYSHFVNYLHPTSSYHNKHPTRVENMKFLSFILALALPILALAQNVVISYPPEGQLIVPGEDFIVKVSLPVRLCYPIITYSTADLCATQGSLTGSTQVSVAIGVASCASAPCRSPADILGDVVYSGPYTPIAYSNVEPEYQNFTVSVPNGFPVGPAQLNIAHFYLVGVRGH
jgi:hypothetical protein